MSGREKPSLVRLGDESFPRATVERALGSLLLERIERLEPVDRISPRSRLVYLIDVASVRYEITIKVAGRSQ